MYVCIYVCMDGWMDGWMDGYTYVRMDIRRKTESRKGKFFLRFRLFSFNSDG